MRLHRLLASVLTLGCVFVAPASSHAMGYRAAHPGRSTLQVRSPARGSSSSRTPRQAVRSATGSDQEQIGLEAEVGWSGLYRDGPAWAPVRVAVRNSGGTTVSGTVEIDDSTIAAAVQADEPASASYGASVVLAPGITKHVTLYLPGTDVQSVVNVRFKQAGRTVATAAAYPTRLESGDLSVGALTGDPSAISWLEQVTLPHARMHVIPLTVSTLDDVPEALDSFDLIALTNLDTSELAPSQVLALEGYVRDGGALLLVGGPNAQQTIGSLPAALLPGRLTSIRALPGLSGLGSLTGRSPRGRSIAGIMSVNRGVTLVEQGGVPLLARSHLGSGVVNYLAVDPAFQPLAGWRGTTALSDRLLVSFMPEAMRRLSIPDGSSSSSFLDPPPGPLDIAQEVSVGGRIPLLPIAAFIVLMALYLILLGPLNLLAVRGIRRPSLTWVTVPALAALCTATTLIVAPRLTQSASVVNELGMVRMDGTSNVYPATVYLDAPATASQSATLTYGSRALPVPIIPQLTPEGSSGAAGDGWAFQEGAQTQIELKPAAAPSMRTVELQTSIRVQGSIRDDLRVTSSGDLRGSVRNGTNLKLLQPAIIAGRAIERLPDIPPHTSAHIDLQPSNDVRDHRYWPTLYHIYGQVSLSEPSSSLSQQGTLVDRLRSAVSALPQTDLVSTMGEVLLVAWTEQPLGAVTLDGQNTATRSLFLIARPMTVRFAPGPMLLRTGTIGADLVQEDPSHPRYACCQPTAGAVYIGSGGSATFEFDLPRTTRLRIRSLSVWAYGGGSDTSYTDYTDMPHGAASVYDWNTHRWDALDFSDAEASLSYPAHLISPTGALLVRLQVRTDDNELTIADPHQDLQLSGSGYVG